MFKAGEQQNLAREDTCSQHDIIPIQFIDRVQLPAAKAKLYTKVLC